MPKLTPETAATLLESTIVTELSSHAANIRELIAQGDIDSSFHLFRLANLDSRGWSDPRTKMTAAYLINLLEKDGLDLGENEKAWLLYCILYDFVDLGGRPLAVLKTESQIMNGEFQPRTKSGRFLVNLWLEIIFSGLLDD
ncbi:MAG: hypothetical protein WAV56_00500 [Microgenomates group bacterium]